MPVDYKKTASDILDNIGGKSNVEHSFNCFTRLRITVKDPGKTNINNLKKVDMVYSVLVEKNLFQIVLGPGIVKKVAAEFNQLLKANKTTNKTKDSSKAMSIKNDWKENKEKIKEQRKRFGWLNRGVKHLANIFSPLVPVVIAAGMFSALATIVLQYGCGGNIETATNNACKAIYYLLTAFKSGFLSYIVIAVGYYSALEFGATPMLGSMLGGVCLAQEITRFAEIIGLYKPDSQILAQGKGGVIGIIISCLLLGYVERFLHKKMPPTLDTVFSPFLSILIVGIVYVFGIMILAGFLSDGIMYVIKHTALSQYTIVRLIAGYISAAIFLPLVMTGLHWGLSTIYTEEITQFGQTSLYPALAMAGAGQVGAAIALFIKSKRMKNNVLIKNITGAFIPGVLGVGEPLIYSVTAPLGLPFITAGLGAGFGGAFIMAMKVGSTAYGPSGLLAVPLMCKVNNQTTALGYLWYILGLLISCAAGFLITYFAIADKRVQPE